MAKHAASGLRLYAEQRPETVRPPIEAIACLPELLRAYQTATGWSLRYVAGPELRNGPSPIWSAPVNPGVGTPLGHFRLVPADSEPQRDPAAAHAQEKQAETQGKQGTGRKARANAKTRRETSAAAPEHGPRRIDAQSARTLASAMAGMLGELLETRHVVWRREAELAAGVPLVPHAEEEKHLAVRLEAVLRGGAQAIGCQAAALYLLDEATTELKLRSCWGLPFDRLTAPARPLQGAVADLEALLGHAVVLEDAEVIGTWRMPEDLPAAVCVPVSTPTTLLGTLWVFSAKSRTFNDHQTNILEVVAGRLAAELEREMLLRENADTAQVKRQLVAAEHLQRSQLPTVAPMLDGWKLAGWTAQSQQVGGDFYDWFCLPNGLLAVTVGHAMDRGIEASLAANALKAMVRAHGQYHREAQQALKQINLTLWTGSAGDQHASLFYGLLETATGRLCSAMAGELGAVLLRNDGWQPIGTLSPRLGESPETDYEQFGYELQPGEAIVLFTKGVRDALDRQGRPLGVAGLIEPLVPKLHLTADQLVLLAQNRVTSYADGPDRCDRTILVIKRQR